MTFCMLYLIHLQPSELQVQYSLINRQKPLIEVIQLWQLHTGQYTNGSRYLYPSSLRKLLSIPVLTNFYYTVIGTVNLKLYQKLKKQFLIFCTQKKSWIIQSINWHESYQQAYCKHVVQGLQSCSKLSANLPCKIACKFAVSNKMSFCRKLTMNARYKFAV